MATLKDIGIKGSDCGLGILLPYTIPGEPPESYARRCELVLRNQDYNSPNAAEIEYQQIFNHYNRKYWSLAESICTSAKRT